MAKPFTPEQREELKARIIGLVRKNGRMTMSQLERATGAGWHSVRRCLVDVLACGDLYMSGKYGVFASEQARKDWQNARKNSRGQRRRNRQRLIRILSGHYQTEKYAATTDI